MFLRNTIISAGCLFSAALAQVIPPQHQFQALQARSNHSSTYKAGQHTLREQDNKTCATNGEKQWTGTIDVTDDRRLFFWFFESRSNPETDPIVIWVNGGPGSSSMVGLFTEAGPCLIKGGADITSPNEWAWNNNASLLFLDQPAGVGFSSVANEAALPSQDLDGAEDFQTFLNVFFTKIFPKKAHLPIHFTAESYGGHYAPTYVNHILESRRLRSPGAFQGNLTSIILVNAYIDAFLGRLGAYEQLCLNDAAHGILNATTCDTMRKEFPNCWKMQSACTAYDDPTICATLNDYCTKIFTLPYFDTGRSAYDIHFTCLTDDDECMDPRFGNYTKYLNQPRVISSLGFPANYTYVNSNADLFTGYYGVSKNYFLPMQKNIGNILDAYQTAGLGDVKILALNGNDDFTCNTYGQKIIYDALEWSGQADFRARAWSDLPKEIAGTGSWKGTKDGRLALVTVDKAGHMVPGYQPKASYQILEKWLAAEWR